MGNPRTVFAALAPWSGAIPAPLWSPQPSITPLRPAGAAIGGSAAAAAARPFQHLQREPPRAGSTVTSQPTTETGSRAKVRAVARPMLQSVSVTMQSLRTSRPDISVGPGGRSGRLLRLGNAHLVGVLRDLVEVPVDDVARRPGERRCPVAEELRHDGERRGRDCSGVRQPLDGYAVRGLRASADGVGHVQETRVQALLRRVSGSPCRSRWRGWLVHRSDHSRRTRPRCSRHWTRCDSRDSDALVTSASEAHPHGSLWTRGEHAQNLVLHHP